MKERTQASWSLAPKRRLCDVDAIEATTPPWNSPRSTASRKHRKAANKPPSKRRSEDIELLRAELARLEHLAQQLRRQDNNLPTDSWQLVAKYEATRRQEALLDNEKLKQTISECRRMYEMLTKHVEKSNQILRCLGSVEDLEWKLGVLSLHPDRRRFNADRIMNQFYSELPTQVIASGITHRQRPTRYSRVEHAELLDHVVYQEVNGLQYFAGSYVQLAESFWQYNREVIPFRDGICFENSVTELFDDHTACWIAKTVARAPIQSPRNTRVIGPAKHMLMRRTIEEGCITFSFKNVKETHEEPSNMDLAEDFCGWFCLQDGGVDDLQEPVTVFQCSLSAKLRPFAGNLTSLVAIASQMQPRECPKASNWDYSTQKAMHKSLRRVFIDYTMNALWKSMLGREELLRGDAASHSNTRFCHATSKDNNVADRMEESPRLPPLRERLKTHLRHQ